LSIKSKLIAGAGTLALVASGMAFAAPAANAATQTLVNCGTSTRIFASLNPTLGSGDARYVKTSVKRNDGAVNHLSLTGAEDFGPSTSDATSCSVDAGIRTTNTATNSASGKDNPFDNQTNGQSTLSMGALTSIGKISGTSAGSASCNRSDVTLNGDYPVAYPLQGKIIYKYTQFDALAKQIQNQFYVRLGADAADPDITHITLDGIVIKGPGVGGDVSATFAFGASYAPTKNLNLLDCTATTAAQNASLASLIISPADGSDVGTVLDDFVVTIPA
jgi:hypothetical protein